MPFSSSFTKARVYAALVLAMFGVHSCAPNENRLTAERAVVDFHQKLNAAQYHEIYDGSDPEFRNAISESDAIAYFAAISTKLGIAKNSELKDWSVDFSANRALVTLFYDTDFVEGRAREEFIWHVHGDRATLFRYNISSPTLVTK